MTLLEIIATLLSLSAAFGFINHNYVRLPHTIGLVLIALAASFVIIGLDFAAPGLRIGSTVRENLEAVDFRNVLLNGFLSAVLFAGAVHVDLSEIAARKWAIGLLATAGVLISTGIVGGLMWAAAKIIGVDLPFLWALVFGALISPTDPVAVIAIMKQMRVPASLYAKITASPY